MYWTRKLAFVILLGVFLGELIFLLALSPGEDFWQHYSAAQAIRSGMVMHEMPRATFGDWIYPYPMFTAVLLLPLSFLPPWLAFTIWVGLLYSVAGMSTYLFASRIAELDRELACLVTITSLIWPVTFIAVFMGQITPLLLAALIAAYLLGQGQRSSFAGLVLSLGLTKPHIVAPVVAGLVLRSKWRWILGFVAGALILTGISLAVGQGTSLDAWQRYVLGWFLGSGRSISLIGRLEFLPDPWRVLLAIVGYCALGIWWFKKPVIRPIDVALGFLISMLLSPYVPAYDLVLLIPVLVLLMSQGDVFFWLGMILSSLGSFWYGLGGLMTLSMICLGVAVVRIQGSAKTILVKEEQ